MKIDGKTIIVVGGASGLGLDSVCRFSAAGAKTVIVCGAYEASLIGRTENRKGDVK
jgi:short-subunit dehydrogenase involved in D-alanine esterification of teichoic acids